MSRTVITDLVLPIVIKQLSSQDVNIPSYSEIQDEQLLAFLEEELLANFGICGQQGQCRQLEQAIQEAQLRDPEGFEQYIKFLLDKYISLRVNISKISETNKVTVKQVIKILTDGKPEGSGPPDRFTEFRKKNPYGPRKWIVEEEAAGGRE